MMPDVPGGGTGEGGLPAAHVLVNGLTLHAGANAARFFVEHALVRHLPTVWPEARFTLLAPPDVDTADPLGFEVCPVPAARGGGGRVAVELLALPRIAARLGADVLVSPHESVPLRLPVPLVVVAQNLLYHCPGGGVPPAPSVTQRLRWRAKFAFYRWQMPRAYARADVVVTVSRHAAAVLSERAGLDTTKVHLVPCGADRLPVASRPPAGATRRLVTVGAVAHYKRLPTLLEALALLSRQGDDYRLVLAGERWSYAEELDAHARRLGVERLLERPGPLDDDALAAELARAHAIVSLSRCESFGVPVVEGMRAGVPAVVAREPWSAELVDGAAVEVDGNDAACVAEGVRALADPEEWERRAAQGRTVAERYTWERTARGVAAAAAAALAR